MGGLATWNLSMRYWDSFSAAVPINGALSVWESFGTDRRNRVLLHNARSLPLFVVHGAEDEQISPRSDRDSAAELGKLGHPCLEYVEVPDGGHGLETLGLTDGEPLWTRLEKWLSDRKRAAWPTKICHRANDDSHGRAHWVRISGITPGRTAEVRARYTAPGHIGVTVRDAGQVTLSLTRPWFTPGHNTAVTLNGVDLPVRFEPDLGTVIDTYRETADAELAAEQLVSFSVPEAGKSPDTHAESNHARTV
jgi:hypothetical protein